MNIRVLGAFGREPGAPRHLAAACGLCAGGGRQSEGQDQQGDGTRHLLKNP